MKFVAFSYTLYIMKVESVDKLINNTFGAENIIRFDMPFFLQYASQFGTKQFLIFSTFYLLIIH